MDLCLCNNHNFFVRCKYLSTNQPAKWNNHELYESETEFILRSAGQKNFNNKFVKLIHFCVLNNRNNIYATIQPNDKL